MSSCPRARGTQPVAIGRARPASPRRQRSIRDLRVCFLGESRTARPGAARGYSAVHRIDAGRGVQRGGTGTGADATAEPRVSDRTSGECRQPDFGRASKGAGCTHPPALRSRSGCSGRPRARPPGPAAYPPPRAPAARTSAPPGGAWRPPALGPHPPFARTRGRRRARLPR